MNLSDKLINEIKAYLDMTWNLTEQEVAKLTGIINRGMQYLDTVAGITQNYEKEGQAKALLMDYVRYVRSNAFDEFQTNYLHELLTFQMIQGGGGDD